MKLAISAGHGMSSRVPGKIDPGADGNGQQEAVMVKGMANRLAQDFSALRWPCLVRDTGHYAQADDDAKAWGAQFFIELHMNAGPPSANGVECLVGGNATVAERRLAAALCRNVSSVSGMYNRGVKVRTDLAVLRQHPMDSVLFEMGFISNVNDMRRYQKSVDKIELAILNAVLTTYGRKPATFLPRKWSLPRRLWARITYR